MNDLMRSIPLSELLTPSENWVTPEPERIYREITVHLWGKGLSLRREVEGSAISGVRRRRVATGEFILSRIDARNGALGLVPPELDGALVSNDFPSFRVNLDVIQPEYLSWIAKTDSFVALCRAASEGTTNRVRLKEQQFLRMKISVPPLSEQRRIIARLGFLASRISQVLKLRDETLLAARRLQGSFVAGAFDEGQRSGWSIARLGDYVIEDRYGSSTKANEDSTGVPVLRMGNIQEGRLDTANLKYLDTADVEPDLRLLRGDLLVNRTNSADLVGKCALFDLADTYTFASYLIRLRLDTRRALPGLVAAYINSPLGRSYMFDERRQMTGQANVNATKIKAMPISLPAITDQRELLERIERFARVANEVTQAQTTRSRELEALLPAATEALIRDPGLNSGGGIRFSNQSKA